MSRVEKLIKEKCPKGIEFKPLSEVFDMRNGYTPSKSNDAYWNNGTINWFRMEDIRANGKRLRDSIQKITPAAVKKGTLFKANSIALSTSATIGEHALLEVDCLTNQRFTVFTLKKKYESMVDMAFVNYYFDIIDIWCKGHLNQGNFASVDIEALKKYEIPVPPLDVQQEIVRILDKFTELEAGLQAELEARKKQHQYYGDILFASGIDKDKWMCVRDVIKSLKTGLNPRKNFVLNAEGADMYYVTGKDITNNAINVSDRTDLISQDVVNMINKRANLEENDVLFVSTGTGTVGRMAVVSEYNNDWAVSETMYCLKPHRELIHSEYLMYVLYSQNAVSQFASRITKGSVPHLKVNDLLDVKIPVPSLDKQASIMDKIKKIDVICNNSENGLPAEIEARHKQYEYYRDKLLTFERKEV